MTQSELALHHQPEWWRVALSSIGDAVITTDMNGRVTFLNPVAETLTGWGLDDASGVPLETVFRIVNEETRETVENPATRALREGLVVGLANHTLLLSRDGSERPIDDSAAPIRNGQGRISGVVLVFRDVTERREAERSLRASEERFRLLVTNVRDYAIFMLDPNGLVSTWNAGAQQIKGYRADEIIGKHFSCFYPPDAVATGFPDTELKVAAEQGRFEDEGWRVRKDGTQFWANVVITALRDEAGQLKGFAKVTRDLTERRQFERAKVQAEVLADVNRRKDDFLAMLSHELRNPLAPILNALHLLRMPDSKDLLHQQATGIIERQVSNLTRLVDDLLEVSRISTGRIRLQLTQLDLRGIVERALETVRGLCAEHRHHVSVALGETPVWLHGDAVRLEQVAVNLLTNAAKYSGEGGQIRVTLKCEEGQAVLRVADTGVGITPDLLPFIFDLFTQAERSLDRAQGGLGVGLTVVQRVVELHGGKVEAHSDGLGKGSEFVVRLPLASAHSDEAQSSAKTESAATPTLRVLVVDDNKDAAESTAILLRRWGHDVFVAYSGQEVLGAALSVRPDAVLLDIGLPGVDGYELARRLRQLPELAKTLLIAVTGYGQQSDRHRASEAGFDVHLTKPVRPERIQEVLAKRPAR